MTMQVLAVDVGSGYTKVATINGESFSFPSNVATLPDSASDRFGWESFAGVVDYKGKKWITGDDAVTVAPRGLEKTRMDSWPGSEGWMALLVRAIHQAGYTSGGIKIVVGIPQAAWSPAFRDSLTVKLVGRHAGTVDGKPFDIEIVKSPAMVLPQAYSGLSHSLDYDVAAFEALKNGALVAGIDPGTYTTGMVVLKGSKVQGDLSGGIHGVGVWAVAQNVHRSLGKEFGYRPTVAEVMPIVREPSKFLIKQEIMDLTYLVTRAVKEVAPPLLDWIEATWDTRMSTMNVVVYGGGASIFLPEIKLVCPQAHRVHSTDKDDQLSPVKGMLSYFATRNDLV